jgi:hypothetical protein
MKISIELTLSKKQLKALAETTGVRTKAQIEKCLREIVSEFIADEVENNKHESRWP